MVIKINDQEYETKPFECWNLMKELRRKHFWHTWNAQKEGDVLVLGMVYGFASFLAGIGKFANPSIGPHFTRLARTPNADGITKAVEAAEAYGLGHYVCGAMKAHLGQLFQGLSQTSPMGDKFKHNFAFCRGCHAIVKSTQIAAEYLDVPILFIDSPYRHTPKLTENTRTYVVNQMMEAIEWLEKTTGKKYDDEKFIEAVKNEWQSMVTWARCCETLKNIPAPASDRTMLSLRLPMVTFKHWKETVDYMNILYDELKYRASQKISDHKMEKLRFSHEGLHPLYKANVLRFAEDYGAVFIAGQTMENYGAWDRFEDGSHVAARTPAERGVEIKTREDAMNALADLNITRGDSAALKCEERYYRALDWKCDGVVIHYDFPCQPAMINSLESTIYLENKGIPVGVYSASQGDPRLFDVNRVLGDSGELPTFFERLGLKKLSESQKSKLASNEPTGEA